MNVSILCVVCEKCNFKYINMSYFIFFDSFPLMGNLSIVVTYFNKHHVYYDKRSR